MDAVFVRRLCLITIAACLSFQTVSGNRQPQWDDDSLLVLKNGIREDTKVGTFLGKLRCTDPDGDDIEYRKTQGNAVSVRQDGSMYLAVELNFEDEDSIGYDLGFECFDLDSFGFAQSFASNNVEMTVNDANDIAPAFTVNSKDGYSFTVSEDALNGFILTPQIQIRDGDRTENAELSALYLICDSPIEAERLAQPETSKATCTKFEIKRNQISENDHTADLILKSNLDFETRRVYSSKLVAIDNSADVSMRLSTTINIQIQVGDAQDVDPLFTNLGTTTVVSEGAQKGDLVNMKIAARDGDVGDRRAVAITMVEDRDNAFTIEQAIENPNDPGVYEAQLRINTPLDREAITGGNYDFVVKVTELDKVTGALTTATATATYAVQVSDIDDQPPLFGQSVYKVDVTEMEFTTKSVQLTGLRISCIDRDETQNAQFQIRIVSQPYADGFSIASQIYTGSAITFLAVANSKYLDYDVPEYRTQTVVLEAKSVGLNPLSSSTTISIQLEDINDNRPIFPKPLYEFNVDENIEALPYIISTITAEDGDSGSNGKITYRLEGGTSNKFTIDQDTGILTLQAAVDYEETPLYVFLVFAEDQNQDPQINQVQVTVRINNVNDILPEFEQQIYQTSVNEDKTNFLTPIDIVAIDTEDGTGRIEYRIVEGQTPDNAFILDRYTGSLTLRRTLDYGTDGRYELKVEASDNGTPSPKTNTVPVFINVIDQNNFKPVLSPKDYSKTLSELAAPGTSVAHVLGTDADGGDFGRITYRISGGGFDNFRVDPDSGVVTVNDPQSFDFDNQKSYNVEVTGSDGGAPQLSDKANIRVTITDANNKKPKFTDSIYIATVDENKPLKYVIETVSATDPDSTADLAFNIRPGSIAARNGAGSLLNDISSYNFLEAIAVNPSNGDVFINNQLDKELALEISFIVQVKDKNNQTANQVDETRVTITITGEANTDLRFDRIEPAIVNEISEEGYEITTVVARDPTTSLGVTNYQQVTNNEFFEVLPSTGQIRLRKQIDYELNPTEHDIVIKAIADDGIRSATATVNIKIIDDNDNAPKFELAPGVTEYSARLDEDAPPLTRIINIIATDMDQGTYGEIAYRIAGGIDSENFILYKSSRGVDVRLAKGVVLNYNERDFYELDIVAMDNPQMLFSANQQTTTVKLKINIIDQNNHAPQFLEDAGVRKMAVAETAVRGTSVGTIVASDDDFGSNGEVTFYLRQVDEKNAIATQLFTIVPSAGIITVAADSLVGYGGKVYIVEVYARDGGDPFLFNRKNVSIEILSTENDDGNPVWLSPANNYVFTAPEETPGHIVTFNGDSVILRANQRTGSGILYRLSTLTPGYSNFDVHNTTGVLTIKESLDREKQETYKLLIYAEDTSDPIRIRTGRQIFIRLTDKDDNDPTFMNPENYPICGKPIARPLEFFFNENVEANTTIYRLRACDPDVNSVIYYYPYDAIDECAVGNRQSKLRVEENGDIVSNTYIDYEVDTLFTMCVIAQKTRVVNSNKRRKRAVNYSLLPENVAYINFHIRDENDNAPTFSKDHEIGVMVTVPGDYPVLVLNAIDGDGVGFNVPIYTIIDSKFYPEGSSTPTKKKAFIMKNNELHANPPRGHTFQEFAKGRFELLIQATDPVNSKFFDTQKVTVYVYISPQAMKVVLGKQPKTGIEVAEQIVSELNSVNSHYTFHYLHASVHKTKDGYDDRRTDVCFIAVDTNGFVILDTFKFISLMGQDIYETGVLANATFEIENVAKCYPTSSSEDKLKWKDLWWVLVVVAIFLGVFAIFCIVIIFAMHRRYRRYMKTEKTYLVPQ